MKIKKRVERLERKIIPPEIIKCHTIIIHQGEGETEAIKHFKKNNNVNANDKFWIIETVVANHTEVKDEI